jgi:hypothetical protein
MAGSELVRIVPKALEVFYLAIEKGVNAASNLRQSLWYLSGSPQRATPTDARFAAIDAQYGRSGCNGKFAGFCDVDPGVVGRVGIWHSHRFCASSRGFRADARAAASSPPENTNPNRANLVKDSFQPSVFQLSVSLREPAAESLYCGFGGLFCCCCGTGCISSGRRGIIGSGERAGTGGGPGCDDGGGSGAVT